MSGLTPEEEAAMVSFGQKSPEDMAAWAAARARLERIAQTRDAFLEAVRQERREWLASAMDKDGLETWAKASAAACVARDAWLAAEAEETP